MKTKNLSLADAESELAEIAEQLDRIKHLEARAGMLRSWIDLGRQITQSKNGTGPAVVEAAGAAQGNAAVVGVGASKVKTADAARAILINSNAPMHIDDLQERMYKQTAWTGSGDKKRDRHNLGVTLTRKDEFENLGGNTWKLVERET